MKTALIALSDEGAMLADRLSRQLPDARLYLHDSVGVQAETKPSSAILRPSSAILSHAEPRRSTKDERAPDFGVAECTPSGFADSVRFSKIIDLTREIFSEYEGLVYFAPCGVVVRALAPNIESKYTDPAVVVVDAGRRYAISLLSGHEGGANALAMAVGNILGAEPVISTTTEAAKSIIVGVGCRRGTKSERIVEAVRTACGRAGVEIHEIRLLASADIKSDEEGLLAAARKLGLPIRFIASDDIRSSSRPFEHSDFVKQKVNLPAVAEPAALLAGRRTRLILPKTILSGITVAIARESFLWSESAPEDH